MEQDFRARALTLEEIITVALLTPMGDPNDRNCIWGAPLLLWGGAGIGKSSRITAAAKGAGLPIEDLFCAGHHPEDFTGIPIQDKGGLRRACALDEVNRLVASTRGVLFLDEISGATPAVQAALLKVALKRYIGDTQLPGGVRVLAAANPPNEAACGWELEPPLANRFIHVDVAPPAAGEWGSWLISGTTSQLDRKSGEEMVQSGWVDEWPQVCGLFKEFIEKQPDLLYALPAEGHPSRGRAWPSPRTMEYAARLVATCRSLCIGIEGQADMVEAAVGSGAALSWLELIRKMDIPAPTAVLDGKWVPDPTRVDIAHAAYSSMLSYVLSSPESDKKSLAVKAWNAFSKGCDAGLADIVGHLSSLLVRGGLGLGAGNRDIAKTAAPILARLGKTGMTQYL